MGFDNAYEAVTESDDDARWAFGTGFEDPLAGVDTSAPDDVDRADLATYCVMIGDDALVMSHRLQQWCTWLPELEEEVAVANIGLDLLGQARLLLTRAAAIGGFEALANDSDIAGGVDAGATRVNGDAAGHADDEGGYAGSGEDRLAFFRDEHEFRNVRLVELENGDFAELVARLLAFSTWRLALLSRLVDSRDPVLSAVAAKGVKEVTYHRDYAAQWVVRLGDGTEYSNQRMRAGVETVWPYVDELFVPDDVERRLAESGVALDPSTLRAEFDDVIAQVLGAATLERPDVPPRPGVGGRTGRHGVHTEAMGYLLAELQSVARAHPDGVW